jgi:hypothetical protein
LLHHIAKRSKEAIAVKEYTNYPKYHRDQSLFLNKKENYPGQWLKEKVYYRPNDLLACVSTGLKTKDDEPNNADQH